MTMGAQQSSTEFSPDPIGFDDWINAMVEATNEFSTNVLGLGDCVVEDDCPTPGRAMVGSYIDLVSDSNAMKAGMIASREHCESLGRMMLGLEDDDPIESCDVSDAVNELINIVGGSVKTIMADRDADLTLGLPIFVNGRIRPIGSMKEARACVKLDQFDATLVVLCTPPPPEAAGENRQK